MDQNDTKSKIIQELDSLKESIKSHFLDSEEHIDETKTIADNTGIAYGPSIGFDFFTYKIDTTKTILEAISHDSFYQNAERFNIYADRIKSWIENESEHLLDHDRSTCVTLSIVLLLDEIEQFSNKNTSLIDPDEQKQRITKLRRSIDSLETQTNTQKDRINNLSEYIDKIIEAKDVADSLPETKAYLDSTNEIITNIKLSAEKSHETIKKIEQFSKDTEVFLSNTQSKIENLLSRAETALRTSIDAGLAQAFTNNAKTLKSSSRWWTAGLAISLLTTSYIGFVRMSSIFEMIKTPNLDPSLIWANIGMSFVILAAPTWFAWIAAKRIAHLFRLIEDYEFKAAISMSYEGYSREAAKFDDSDFAERVLNSAITRFDEPPLRFVEPKDNGHPLLELIERFISRKSNISPKNNKPPTATEPPHSSGTPDPSN